MFDRFVHNMSTLTRYEASIERQLNRAIALLEHLQGQRGRRAERPHEEPELRLLQPTEGGPQKR